MMQQHVFVVDKETREECLAPDVIFRLVCRDFLTFTLEEVVIEQIAAELRECAMNTGLLSSSTSYITHAHER